MCWAYLLTKIYLLQRYIRKKNRYSFPSTWLDPQLQSELKKPKGIPVVMVYDKSGLLVQYEKGQMFAEDVQALSRWI